MGSQQGEVGTDCLGLSGEGAFPGCLFVHIYNFFLNGYCGRGPEKHWHSCIRDGMCLGHEAGADQSYIYFVHCNILL